MKKFLPILLAATITLPAGIALGQSAYTDPVGYVSFAPAPSTNGVSRKFTVASFPMQSQPVWTGVVQGEPSGATLTGANATWGSYQAANGFATHLIRFKSGAAIGQIYPIQTNNTTTATVVLPSSISNLGSVADSGDSFEIFPVNTFRKLFGDTPATVKFQQNALQDNADIIYIWNGSAWVANWFDGSQWINEGDEFSDGGDTPIYSDEPVWIARKSTGVIEYKLVGTVPTPSSMAIEVPGTATSARKFTFISNPFPKDITIADLGLKNLTNWISNPLQDNADLAYVWNGAAWVAYWHDGSQWINEGDEFSDGGADPVPLGGGVWVARKSSSPTGVGAFTTITRPYSLN